MMPLISREKSSLKGRWRLETVQDMRYSSSNPVSCSETSIKIYGSKEEIRYRVSCTASTRLVTTTFRRAYAERGYPQSLTFHSDRGGQYISAAFSKLLQQYGVKQSFSASGTPLDNAVAETFFATFKKEEAYRREYTSERHFRKSVDEYIRFYNEIRPHQTLKYKTPQAFEAAYQGNYIEKPCSYSNVGV